MMPFLEKVYLRENIESVCTAKLVSVDGLESIVVVLFFRCAAVDE